MFVLGNLTVVELIVILELSNQIDIAPKMGNSGKSGLRSEGGKREVADSLHLEFNKRLQCPACHYKCDIRGAFDKDCGGTRDETGQFYRRFKCRDRNRCTKTLGMTEMLELCQKQEFNASSRLLKQLSTFSYTRK